MALGSVQNISCMVQDKKQSGSLDVFSSVSKFSFFNCASNRKQKNQATRGSMLFVHSFIFSELQ